MFGLGASELTIIAVVLVLLFVIMKLPQLVKGLGGLVKEFRKGINEDK